MKNVKTAILCTLLTGIMLLPAGCGENSEQYKSTSTSTVSITSASAVQTEVVTISLTDVTNIQDEKEDEPMLNLTIDGKQYQAKLFDSTTRNDIEKMLPLELTLTRYAGHEYYSELPSTPDMDKNTTSNILAGHIYYWDGWNAFVINYEDYDISPYKVVHIGEITDKSVVEQLKNANNEITVKVKGASQ